MRFALWHSMTLVRTSVIAGKSDNDAIYSLVLLLYFGAFAATHLYIRALFHSCRLLPVFLKSFCLHVLCNDLFLHDALIVEYILRTHVFLRSHVFINVQAQDTSFFLAWIPCF